MALTSEQQRKIYTLAEKSSTARAIFRNFRERERDPSQHTAERLLQIALKNVAEDAKNPPTYKDVIEIVKEFARLELGYYRQGRKGHKTRVEWIEGVALKEVGNAGLVKAEELDEEMAKARSMRSGTNGTPVVKHRYQLRPNFTFEYAVPEDITAGEARSLAAIVGAACTK